MKLKAAVKYRMEETRKALLTFFAILVAITAALGVGAVSISVPDHIDISLSGGETASVIFVFVLGLCAFKETFRLLLQNGLSRRTMFLSYVITALLVSGAMSILVNLLNAFGKVLSAGHPNLHFAYMTEVMYGDRYQAAGQAQVFLESLLFFFFLFAFAMTAGYLITTGFYRLSRAGRIAAGVGIPVFLLIVLPIFDGLIMGGRISIFVFETFIRAFGLGGAQNPFIAMGSCLLGFVVFSGLEWLLARRAVIRD